MIERPADSNVGGLFDLPTFVSRAMPLRDIAEAIGKGVNVPVVSIPTDKAEEHFGAFAHFATLDMSASNEWTLKTLGWDPIRPGMIEDLTNMMHV